MGFLRLLRSLNYCFKDCLVPNKSTSQPAPSETIPRSEKRKTLAFIGRKDVFRNEVCVFLLSSLFIDDMYQHQLVAGRRRSSTSSSLVEVPHLPVEKVSSERRKSVDRTNSSKAADRYAAKTGSGKSTPTSTDGNGECCSCFYFV